jgi:hypothetical protein
MNGKKASGSSVAFKHAVGYVDAHVATNEATELVQK